MAAARAPAEAKLEHCIYGLLCVAMVIALRRCRQTCTDAGTTLAALPGAVLRRAHQELSGWSHGPPVAALAARDVALAGVAGVVAVAALAADFSLLIMTLSTLVTLEGGQLAFTTVISASVVLAAVGLESQRAALRRLAWVLLAMALLAHVAVAAARDKAMQELVWASLWPDAPFQCDGAHLGAAVGVALLAPMAHVLAARFLVATAAEQLLRFARVAPARGLSAIAGVSAQLCDAVLPALTSFTVTVLMVVADAVAAIARLLGAVPGVVLIAWQAWRAPWRGRRRSEAEKRHQERLTELQHEAEEASLRRRIGFERVLQLRWQTGMHACLQAAMADSFECLSKTFEESTETLCTQATEEVRSQLGDGQLGRLLGGAITAPLGPLPGLLGRVFMGRSERAAGTVSANGHVDGR